MELLKGIVNVIAASQDNRPFISKQFYEPLLEKGVIPVCMFIEGPEIDQIEASKPPGTKIHGVIVTLWIPPNTFQA